MKNIFIYLIAFLPFLSFMPPTPTLQSSCVVCPKGDVLFTGNGYTAGRSITVAYWNTNGDGFTNFNTCIVDASGQIRFSIPFSIVDTYSISVFQSKGSNRWDFKTSINVTIQ